MYCCCVLLLCTAALYCSLKLYNNLVEKCFKDCVLDFRSKNLGKDEQQVGQFVGSNTSSSTSSTSMLIQTLLLLTLFCARLNHSCAICPAVCDQVL